MPSPPEKLEKAVKSYCEKAESLHATLPLAGFKTKLRVPIDLADLYVPLSAMLDLRGVGDARFADAGDAEEKLRGRSAEISLIDAFREGERRHQRGLVILGDPGSGKTTHLKRILLKCLRDGPGSLGLPDDTLPVFLPLRDLRDLGQGLDGFIEAQLDDPHLETPKGFGKQLLDRGKLLFLLDGLDEVADPSHRERVARWIEGAIGAFGSCRFAVTCRFAGYTEKARLDERFLELHIRPLTAEQAETFVHNWYRIVERGLAVNPAQGEVTGDRQAQELVERLRQPDFRARRVFELTRNPLLLANLCLVHRDRGRLPHRRADLYDECIDVLLERWREAKKLDVGVGAKAGRRVLQPAAYWLHGEENRTRATAGELCPVIEPVLQEIRYEKGGAKDFLATVRDESGLLVGWGDERFGFMHLGFQEYLAAREISRRYCLRDDGPLRELAARFGESWWQEVSLLLLALADPPLFEPLMEEVVRQKAFAEQWDLVEQCLDDTFAVSEAPFLQLLQEPPGKSRALWTRQLAALRILERLDSTALDGLRKTLRDHPSPDIRKWLGRQERKAAKEVILSIRGGCELVLVPGGRFRMGGKARKPTHEVNVPAFYIGRYAVTNEEYARFLRERPGAREPEYWGNRQFNQPRQPVVGVDWNEARAFAEWAGGRLPSEAEWEYVCRAGTTTEYHSGDSKRDLDRVGWHVGNSGGKLHPVGEKEPNALGLYDMHGNVWEWVEDDWHDNYKGAPADGSAWVDEPRGAGRVLRGGSWGRVAGGCRSAVRDGGLPGSRDGDVGFRLVLDVK